MIPKYFKCNDPAKKCPLALSGDINRVSSDFACPCSNEACLLNREELSLASVLPRWIIGVVAAAILLAVCLLIFSGGDPSKKAIESLRTQLSPLESQLQQLEAKAKSLGSSQASAPDPKPLQLAAEALDRQSHEALASQDPMRVAEIHKKITSQGTTVKGILESMDRPRAGSGVLAADAKSLVNKFSDLEEKAEAELEPVMADSQQSVEVCEAFLAEIASYKGRARRIASPASSTEPTMESKSVRQSLSQLLSQLDSLGKKLSQFAPPPPLPFQETDADLIITASGNLASGLIAPLTCQWLKSTAIPSADGNLYITGNNQKRILIKPVSPSIGFQLLAEGKCALFFADRAPTSQELANFGSGYSESRSFAEVVALDALTLLVHPDNEVTSFNVGSQIPFPIASGPSDSALRSKADQFDIPSGSIEASGENAALANREVVSLGFYHEEGANLRAKRLAVRATPEALALKPSPFTIATEDYLFSFRIVAWTNSKSPKEAMELVKFTTSNEGQEIVAKHGYVDLRLTASQGEVQPEILAALGAAIGSDTISSAVRLSTNFRFDVGKSNLDLKAQADMERLPRYVFDQYPTHKVVVLGFTDSDGGPEINLPLSRDRAEVVCKELRTFKVEARSAGLGPIFPVDTNSTVSGKAKNRRAEVWVVRP